MRGKYRKYYARISAFVIKRSRLNTYQPRHFCLGIRFYIKTFLALIVFKSYKKTAKGIAFPGARWYTKINKVKG